MIYLRVNDLKLFETWSPSASFCVEVEVELCAAVKHSSSRAERVVSATSVRFILLLGTLVRLSITVARLLHLYNKVGQADITISNQVVVLDDRLFN